MADVAMPRLSDSMEEGTILKWLKSDGDEVKRGEELVEIETDKANMTYEADQDGVLKIVASEGDTLPVGETIASIGEGSGGDSGGEQPDAESQEESEPTAEDEAQSEAEEDSEPEAETQPAAEEESEPQAEEESEPQAEEESAPQAEEESEPQAEGESEPEAEEESEPQAEDESEPQAEEESQPEAEEESAPEAEEESAPDAQGSGGGENGRIKASPVARRMAREMGLELARLEGTGPGGRIVKADVEAAAEGSGDEEAEPAAEEQSEPTAEETPKAEEPKAEEADEEPKAEEPKADEAKAQEPEAEESKAEEPATAEPKAEEAKAEESKAEEPKREVPSPVAAGEVESGRGEATIQELTRLQKTVARRMAESKATAPEFVLNVDVDMEQAVELRKQLKVASGDKPAPSFNDFVIKACALALTEFPRANGAYRDGKFELYSRVNVGVAVAGQDALVVPTVFDADRKSLGQIARESRALAERVRAGKITPPELSSGTFTVSNLGMFGIDHFIAVINPPQAAILAVGAMKPQAVVQDGEITARTLMKLTLACDHRILYGSDAAEFLARIRELLENPLSLAL